MPRLSLWKSGQHTNDYKFIDRHVSEQFTIGATDMVVHKLLSSGGTGVAGDATQPNNTDAGILGIQDLLFLENRDRKYEEDVYTLRGHYNTQDNDLSNEQFGLFLSNDNLYLTFHINDMVERIGRKILPGDVLELPHLIDYWALDDGVPLALKKFYVVDDASRAGEGYSPTWWPHLWRVKVKPMTDSQEYADILNRLQEGTDDGDGNNQTLRDLLSVYNQELENNAAVIAQAEAEVPQSGYDTSNLYIMPTEEDGEPADPDTATPRYNGYTDGYLTGDGLAPNGHTVTSGTSFPDSPSEGDYALRLDFLPNRLFRYSGTHWIKIEDAERTSLTPGEGQTQRGGFVNNNNITYTDDNQVIDQRVALSKALSLEVDDPVPVSSTEPSITDPTTSRPSWVSPASGNLGSFGESASYSQTFVATGIGTVTYSLISGSLPSGLTLSSAGVLSGTMGQVTVNTVYQFAIRATDDNGTSDRSFYLTIADYNPFGSEFSSEFN